jgi:hypothetical protein
MLSLMPRHQRLHESQRGLIDQIINVVIVASAHMIHGFIKFIKFMKIHGFIKFMASALSAPTFDQIRWLQHYPLPISCLLRGPIDQIIMGYANLTATCR